MNVLMSFLECKMDIAIKDGRVVNKKTYFLHQFLVLLIISLLFLTPYGIKFDEKVIWLTDLISLLVIFIVLSLFISGYTGVRRGERVNLSLLFLILFFFLELILPMIGVVAWGDLSSAASSFRAIIYWLPFLMILTIRPFNSNDALKILDKIIIIAVILNLIIGLIELSIYLELVSESWNFRIYLSDFAPQDRYLNNRIMSFGFFQNSTAYGVFGFVSLIHFLSRILQTDSDKLKFYMYALLSLFIVILSASRVPLMTAFISFFFFLLFLRKTRWNLMFSIILFIFSSITLVVLFTSDYMLFSRFSRLVEGGLSGDYSLNQRLFIYWPQALYFYNELGHPTFTNPTKYIGTIDSGYLTYLLQGGVGMVFSLISFLLISILSSLKEVLIYKERGYFPYFLFFICIYIILGMVVSNPMRNPIVIFFLCYAVCGFSFRQELKGYV